MIKEPYFGMFGWLRKRIEETWFGKYKLSLDELNSIEESIRKESDMVRKQAVEQEQWDLLMLLFNRLPTIGGKDKTEIDIEVSKGVSEIINVVLERAYPEQYKKIKKQQQEAQCKP